MSKLTEEQIKEIEDMWSALSENWQQSLRRWNALQPQSDEFFKIPWQDAPAGVDDVEIGYRFGDRKGNHYDIEYLYLKIPERFKKPVAHRHAPLMAKYAEVAARRPDPWIEFGYFYEGEKVRFEEEVIFYETDDYEYLGEVNENYDAQRIL
jgi:hypothetical protein